MYDNIIRSSDYSYNIIIMYEQIKLYIPGTIVQFYVSVLLLRCSKDTSSIYGTRLHQIMSPVKWSQNSEYVP